MEDRLEIIIGGKYLALHLFADEKSDRLNNWLNLNRLVEVGQLGRNKILETIEWCENICVDIVLMIIWNYFDSLIWFPESLFNRVDQLQPAVPVQPIIQPVRFFVRRKMKSSIFTSDNNFKSLFHLLRYFKGQLFDGPIIKLRFFRSMFSFSKNDLTYHA